MNQQHVMLDLETMSVKPNAAIVAIGACKFSLPYVIDVYPAFYQQVSLESSMAAGLAVDADTILWWLQQSDAARKTTFEGDDVVPVDVALKRFVHWLGLTDEILMWGNGANFDNVIIRSAFNAVSVVVPWHYRNDRCYRTACKLLPKLKFGGSGIKHNALDDALAQARHLQKVYSTSCL